MGLIKAGATALGQTFADQWLEFVAIEGIESNNVLVQREYPRTNGSNTKATQGVLTKGTRITVPEGMAMMIVDQGKIAEFTAEAGEFVYDSSTEPTVFYGGLGAGIKNSFKRFTDNFKFGGATPKDQRVYYINLREIPGINFGTAEPMAFPDPKYDITVYLRFYGKYSIKVTDPISFVANVVSSAPGDVVTTDVFLKQGQMREEFITHLTSSLAILANEERASFGDLPRYQSKLAKIMNEELDDEWRTNRGIEIISVAIPSVSLTEKSQEDIRKYDEINVATNKGPGIMTLATAEAMKNAASNEAGMSGMFMGMNAGKMMSDNMTTVADAVFANQNNDTNNTNPNETAPTTEPAPAPSAEEEPKVDTIAYVEGKEKSSDEWNCPTCSKKMKGNFCVNCGTKKPEETANKCSNCGEKLDKDSKFCSGCGTKVEE